MSDPAPAPEPDSLDAALALLRARFDPAAARGLSTVYQFELSGPGGGACHAQVDEGRVEVGHGAHPGAQVTFRLSALDFFAVLSGRANADMLFMEERIELKGDLALALKLRRLFPRAA